MNLSRREIDLVLKELDHLAVPSRIQRVFEDTPRRLVLQLRAPGQTFHLLIAVEDDDTRLHLVDGKPRGPRHPAPFTMQLRKWIQGAWIEAIRLRPDDRVVHLDLQAIDPTWEPADDEDRPPRLAITLVVELVGHHPNLFLLDEEGAILGAARHRALGERDASAGSPYVEPTPPPPSEADHLDPLNLGDLPPNQTRSRRLQAYFDETLLQQRQQNLRRQLAGELRSHAKRLRRRIAHIQEDLTRIEDAEEFRRRGELLQSAYGKVEPGAVSVTVPDFYAEGLLPVDIPLDPSKSLQQNIARYFHQYRRYSAARDQVEERLLNTMELLEEIQQARQTLAGLDDIEALLELENQLRAAKTLPRRRAQKRSRKPSTPLPPYREFRATSGATILVGRGARHNDELTISVARGRDLWLHARDWAGAHVILRQDRSQEVKSEDLVDAAILAAYFSRGKRDTLVDVTYTQAKHVRKPPGAAPGLVTVGGGSTLGVRIDEPRLERLLDSEIPHG